MIQEQLQLKLSQARALVTQLEAALGDARQRFDSACIAAARAPAGFVDKQATVEDENVRLYSQKLHGARLALQQLEAEQSAEGFAERVAEADRLLAAVESTPFVSELERDFAKRVADIGRDFASTYLEAFDAIRAREQKAGEAVRAAEAVGVRLEDSSRLFGDIRQVMSLFSAAFWRGALGTLPAPEGPYRADHSVFVRLCLTQHQ